MTSRNTFGLASSLAVILVASSVITVSAQETSPAVATAAPQNVAECLKMLRQLGPIMEAQGVSQQKRDSVRDKAQAMAGQCTKMSFEEAFTNYKDIVGAVGLK